MSLDVVTFYTSDRNENLHRVTLVDIKLRNKNFQFGFHYFKMKKIIFDATSYEYFHAVYIKSMEVFRVTTKPPQEWFGTKLNVLTLERTVFSIPSNDPDYGSLSTQTVTQASRDRQLECPSVWFRSKPLQASFVVT